jgi:transcriptional regulator with XRE-family HTH domain
MRDTSQPSRGRWADYIEDIVSGSKTGKKLAVAELARLVGVERQTASLWRSGKQIPTSYGIVAAVARVAGDDPRVAARAAGLESEAGGEADDDVTIREIMQSAASDETKAKLVEMVKRRRRRAEETLREDVRDLLSQEEA